MRRLLCWLFGHRWKITAHPWIEIHCDYSGEPGRLEPWGNFVRCQRCGAPDPLWDYSWFPDEEDAEDYQDAQEALEDHRAGEGISISDVHEEMKARGDL